MTRDDELLLEQVVAAHRERDLEGRVKSHPAWHDLDAAGRQEAYEETLRQRALEQATHPQGLSATAVLVLARITRRSPGPR